MKIIACDFDGTLCENKYPNIGEPKTNTINKLLSEQKNGAKIILWTCRTNLQVIEAVDWCKNHGIVFDAINDNLPETVNSFGYNPRKIYASEYWDDRNIFIGELNK